MVGLRRRHVGALLVVCALLVSTIVLVNRGRQQAPEQTPVTGTPCTQATDFLLIPGQGLSCYANGLFHVRLRNGTQVATHGPDRRTALTPPALCLPLLACPPPPTTGPSASPGPSSSSSSSSSCLLIFRCGGGGGGNPTPLPYVKPTTKCADPATYAHVEMIYAHWSDRADNVASFASTLAAVPDGISTTITTQAQQHDGSTKTYDVIRECDAAGVTVVHDAVLNTAFAQSDYGSIVSDLQADGYSNTRADYIVYTDGNPTPYGGQGSVGGPGPDGPLYAVDYGWGGAFTHEFTHNMGAVAGDAPHSTGAWHCNDGPDVMCYDDGGPNGAQTTACDYYAYDCNADDYFNPDPPAGSYLATHYNLGSDANAWLLIH